MESAKLCYEKSIYSDILKRNIGLGDDAPPYVGSHMISVADGTGGRSFEKQRGIHHSLTDRTQSFSIALGNIISSKYQAQYDSSFSYLYDVGEHYAQHPRKGCYFGSRFASIFMRKIVEEGLLASSGEEDGAKRLFEKLSGLDQVSLDQELQRVEKELQEELVVMLRQAVDNCGITSRNGFQRNTSLIGTTYSGIVFFEEEEKVHLLSIQAGDSLPFAIEFDHDDESGQADASLTLRLLQAPQEREVDGGLVNIISVEHDFYLRCAYHCVQKPCGILVCSDGVFGAFNTMPLFEKYVMDEMSQSSTLQDLFSRLNTHYKNGASNDDSSTASMVLFGVEDFSVLCAAAKKRSDLLTEKYLMESLPVDRDQLEREMEQITYEKNMVLLSFRDELWEKSAILRRACERDFSEEQLRELQEMQKARRSELSEQISSCVQSAVRIVGRYWCAIKPNERIRQLQSQIQQDASEQQENYHLFCYHRSLLEGSIRSASEDEDPEAGPEAYEQTLRWWGSLQDSLSMMEQTGKTLQKMNAQHKDRQKKLENEKERYQSSSQQQIRQWTEKALADPADSMQLQAVVPDQELRMLHQYKKNYQQMQAEVDLTTEKVLMGYLKRAFDEQSFRYLLPFYEGTEHDIPEDLLARINAQISSIEEKYREPIQLDHRIKELDEKYRGELEKIMYKREM